MSHCFGCGMDGGCFCEYTPKEISMDFIQGHHVDKIELHGYDMGLHVQVSYDFEETMQRYLLTVDGKELSKTQARELRDFLNGLPLDGRG